MVSYAATKTFTERVFVSEIQSPSRERLRRGGENWRHPPYRKEP